MPTQTTSTIRIGIHSDARSTLTVVRADGSRTWGKLHPSFPEHDLMHLAVESVLGAREGFFGLVAAGWSIDDFAAPGAAARMPLEALRIEMIVGQLELDRGQGTRSSAEEVNERLALAFSARKMDSPPLLTADQVAQVWRMHGELVAKWRAVEPGGTLEVGFPYVK